MKKYDKQLDFLFQGMGSKEVLMKLLNPANADLSDVKKLLAIINVIEKWMADVEPVWEDVDKTMSELPEPTNMYGIGW